MADEAIEELIQTLQSDPYCVGERDCRRLIAEIDRLKASTEQYRSAFNRLRKRIARNAQAEAEVHGGNRADCGAYMRDLKEFAKQIAAELEVENGM